MTVQQWYDSIGKRDSVFDVPDPDKFKKATAAILCSVLHLDSVQKQEELKEFCQISKKMLGLDEAQLKQHFATNDAVDRNIRENCEIIKEQLGNDKYKMLQFMKMLNRFIMVDKCKEEDYCIFEKVHTFLFDD